MSAHEASSHGSPVVAIAFATTVGMWAVGYVGRLPLVLAPNGIVLTGFVLALLGGGIAYGRYADSSASKAALVGLAVGCLNMLILGSLLADLPAESHAPSVWIWLPGALLASSAATSLGAAVGRARSRRWVGARWPFVLACVAVVATSLLVLAGGLVTGHDAGLAVPDWPTSFESNMFLYPLSRMTGGIYYEHAHRLFGTLVGLTTVALAVQVLRNDTRRGVRILALVAVGAVIIQGIMGGYRVTLAKVGDGITLSTLEDETMISAFLRVAHGVFGQVVLSTLAAMAALQAPGWRGARVIEARSARFDHLLATLLVVGLVLQLVLGAILRHMHGMLFAHVGFAAFALTLAAVAGMRAWGVHRASPVLRRLGMAVALTAIVQLSLGLVALIATGSPDVALVANALLSTVHQGVGAALLVLAVALALWTRRVLRVPAARRPAVQH